MANPHRRCPVCNNTVPTYAYSLKCNLCRCYIHRNCTNLMREEYNELYLDSNLWSCQICNEHVFPFNHIADDSEYSLAIYELQLNRANGPGNYKTIAFDPFHIADNDENDTPLHDLDPDSAYFREHAYYLGSTSNYYTEDLFNKKVNHDRSQTNYLSMIHLNIKSVASKLSNFLAFLENVNETFSVIALSETWLTTANQDCYAIPGYNHIALIRPDRIGGGVSLFIKDNIDFKELKHVSASDAVMESLFVQISVCHKKYNIGVIYHPPNSNLRTFTEMLSEKLDMLKCDNAPTYILGDYNADLLKSDSHKPTAEFLDMMFSHSFIPLINRPTRITDETSTLIDNIYTNNYNIGTKTLQGILSPNISDHEAIFHLYGINDSVSSDKNEYCLIRKMGPNNYQQYVNEISKIDWAIMRRYNTCNTAFSFFSSTLRSVYNKSFPIIKVKQKYRNRLPWLTTGLKESIKHKNKLYKLQMIHPTTYNKCIYKQFRNKLNYLIKQEEKSYYQNLILINKSNLTKTWRIIKEVINKHKPSRQIKQFMHNGKIITDKKEIATCFNDFFCKYWTISCI